MDWQQCFHRLEFYYDCIEYEKIDAMALWKLETLVVHGRLYLALERQTS